jgi:hypothetical protein
MNRHTKGNGASILRTRVVGIIDAAFDRMVSNAASAIARRVHAAANEGKAIEEAEQLVREIVSAELRDLTARLAFALRIKDKVNVYDR